MINSPDYQTKINENAIHHKNCTKLGNIVLDIYEKVTADITQIENNIFKLEQELKNEILANNKLIQQAELCYEKPNEFKLIRDNIKAIKLRKKTALKQPDSLDKGNLISLLNELIAKGAESLTAKINTALLSAGLYQTYEERNVNILNLENIKEELSKKKLDGINEFIPLLIEESNKQGLDANFVKNYLPVERYHRYVEEKTVCFMDRNNPQLELLEINAQKISNTLQELILDDSHWQKVVNTLLGFLWLKVRGTQQGLYQYI